MKKFISLFICCLVFCTSVFSVSANSNYEEYVYNTAGESVAAPTSYSSVSVIYGNEETDVSFSSPQDIFVDDSGNLYILDSGNDRIMVYNTDLSVVSVISGAVINEKTISFKTCTGLFVINEEIYIADKDNGVIYVVSTNGVGNRIIPFVPQSVVEDNFIYKPMRITVDENGIIQVQAEGCYNGIITLDSLGNMIGYYSANTVQASFSVIAAQFWKKIFSDEQQDSIKQIIPIEYSSIAMDTQGFVYTVTKTTENSTFEIKKLNPYGDNILGYDDTFSNIKIGNGDYGDLRMYRTGGTNVDTAFCDIYVDQENFIFALDATRGRVFQYDQNSNLISVFGGMGDQVGTFSEPIAVDGYNGNIFVLDATKGSLTVFEPQEYVNNIRKALIYDEDCNYEESVKYWKKVYSSNANYSLALTGLGKAEYQNGNVKEAMDFFKRADDRTNYDIAFSAYRTQFIRDNFIWIGIALLIVISALSIKIIHKKRQK